MLEMGYSSRAEQYTSQNWMLQAQLIRNQNALSIFLALALMGLQQKAHVVC